MSVPQKIITSRLIWKHNLRCLGRLILWLAGSASIFLVVFLFAWVVASVFGQSELTVAVGLFCLSVALGVFLKGHQYLVKHGPKDWEKVAQKSDRKPGMRLGRLGQEDYEQMGVASMALVLGGPKWLGQARDEFRKLLPRDAVTVSRLEKLRMHLSAREGWVPLNDFKKHEQDIRSLVLLDILAVRELMGQWCFHVTLSGLVKRDAVVDVDTEK